MEIDAIAHRALAVEANNSAWEFISRKPESLSPDEVEELTNHAHAAAYHWSRAEGATPTNRARAQWLLARTWVHRGNGELARHYAHACMSTTRSIGNEGFDLAYAHEVLARAYACVGRIDDAARHLHLARSIHIPGDKDREIFNADLAAAPWFGLSLD